MRVTVNTQAEVRPSGPITPAAIHELVKTVVGKSLVIDIADTKTVQDLADAADALMSIDPAVTVNEKIVLAGDVLDLKKTLKAAGVKDGDVLKYTHVIKA